MIWRLYKVFYSKPGKTGYRINKTMTVITDDVVGAAKMCKEAEPESTVWNVQHIGLVESVDPRAIDNLVMARGE